MSKNEEYVPGLVEWGRGVSREILEDIGYVIPDGRQNIGRIAMKGETNFPVGLNFFPESQGEKQIAQSGINQEFNRVNTKPIGAKVRIRTVVYEAFERVNTGKINFENFEHELQDNVSSDDIRQNNFVQEQISRFIVLEKIYSNLEKDQKLPKFEKIRSESNKLLDEGFDSMSDDQLKSYYLKTKENIWNRYEFWSKQLELAKGHYLARDYIK